MGLLQAHHAGSTTDRAGDVDPGGSQRVENHESRPRPPRHHPARERGEDGRARRVRWDPGGPVAPYPRSAGGTTPFVGVASGTASAPAAAEIIQYASCFGEGARTAAAAGGEENVCDHRGPCARRWTQVTAFGSYINATGR